MHAHPWHTCARSEQAISELLAVIGEDLDRDAIIKRQVSVGFGHATDSPRERVLHLGFERGLEFVLTEGATLPFLNGIYRSPL